MASWKSSLSIKWKNFYKWWNILSVKGSKDIYISLFYSWKTKTFFQVVNSCGKRNTSSFCCFFSLHTVTFYKNEIFFGLLLKQFSVKLLILSLFTIPPLTHNINTSFPSLLLFLNLARTDEHISHIVVLPLAHCSQLSSSDWSSQSKCPSHRHLAGMQRWVSHWKPLSQTKTE